MTRRVAVTVTTLTLLATGALGGETTRAAASDAPATSALRAFDTLDPVPMPQVVPLAPGPVPMPVVEPHGRPVPMPLVDPDLSAGHLVPQQFRRVR